MVDSEAKIDKQGEVTMELAFRGVQSDTLVFRVAMDPMKMDAPPLAEYDLAKLARLTGLGGAGERRFAWKTAPAGK